MATTSLWFLLLLLLGAIDVSANPLDETCDATCLTNAIKWLKFKEEHSFKKCRRKCKRNAWSKANDCRGKCCKRICNQSPGEEQEACEEAGFCPDPTEGPTEAPSLEPSLGQFQSPSEEPSQTTSADPTLLPSYMPSKGPTDVPSSEPSSLSSYVPSEGPTLLPSYMPSDKPNILPSEVPSTLPSVSPSMRPSYNPSGLPSILPSSLPSTLPSVSPSMRLSYNPSGLPSILPSSLPSTLPSVSPSGSPSAIPSDAPSALCDDTKCDVTEFPGNDDEKIVAAMAAALQSSHKTLYFPNGSYRITKSIQIKVLSVDLVIQGESVDGVVLVSDPIITSNNCFGAMINIDRAGGFKSLFLKIEKMTLDFSANHEHPIFLEAGCSGSGHGVRVGNGWDTGSLHLNELKILKAPGYGIGIQNSGTGDKDADNVLLTKIRVEDVGMDGLDTKQSPSGGNSHLTIIDMTIKEIGFNDELSAAALDISYDDFHLERISIVTDAFRENPKGRAQNTGIRIRERIGTPASDGTIQDLYTKGCLHPVFFEGKTPHRNENVTLTNFIIKNFNGNGIYIRGEDHTFRDGCVYGGKGPNARNWYINGANSDPSTIEIVNVFTKGSDPRCPSHSAVGSDF